MFDAAGVRRKGWSRSKPQGVEAEIGPIGAWEVWMKGENSLSA